MMTIQTSLALNYWHGFNKGMRDAWRDFEQGTK